MGGKLSQGTTLYPPFISCKLIIFTVSIQGVKCRGVKCRGVKCRGVKCRGVKCRITANKLCYGELIIIQSNYIERE